MLLVVMSLTNCTKNFDEINTPKDVLVMDETLLGQAFAKAQYSAMAGQYQQTQNLFADNYAQYFATTHARFNSDQFEENATWVNTGFNEFYTGAAPQLFAVENYTKDDMPVENAVAKVWRVQM